MSLLPRVGLPSSQSGDLQLIYARKREGNRRVHFVFLVQRQYTIIMSDFGDEMDVDAPTNEVQFSSENASGKKRSAADLPVEAQDNLPWYEDAARWSNLSA